MIPPGEGKVGKKIVCPNGAGEIVAVLDNDNVKIKLDYKAMYGKKEKDVFAIFDLSGCAWAEDEKELARIPK